jgi:hypothetical protein
MEEPRKNSNNLRRAKRSASLDRYLCCGRRRRPSQCPYRHKATQKNARKRPCLVRYSKMRYRCSSNRSPRIVGVATSGTKSNGLHGKMCSKVSRAPDQEFQLVAHGPHAARLCVLYGPLICTVILCHSA